MAINDGAISSTSTTTTSGVPKPRSMQVTRTATGKPMAIRTSFHSSRRHVSRAIPQTTGAYLIREPRS
jgi:hypothetical protein